MAGARRSFQDHLSEIKHRVCITPQEEEERTAELHALADDFVRRTSATGIAIARAYHTVLQRGEVAATSCQAALVAAIGGLRDDGADGTGGGGSLTVVSIGRAGGIKVSDSRDGAFFKISEDQDGLYEGSLVMAGKPAKHELRSVGFLHGFLDGAHLTVPLVSCADVTVRDGEASRVYRVQAFSALDIDSSTLREGSSDGGATIHLCEALRGPLETVAAAFHLAPGRFRGGSGGVTVHSYEALVAEERQAGRIAGVGAALGKLLQDLGVGIEAPTASGPCLELELAASGEAGSSVVLDPLRRVSREYVVGQASAVGLPSGASGRGGSVVHALPYDVECHVLPVSGETCIADTHRLCIPEVTRGADQAGVVAVLIRADGTVTETACGSRADMSRSPRLLAATAARAAGMSGTRAVHEVRVVSGTGCAVVSWEGVDDVVVLSQPLMYWKAIHLTALFPPEAGSVLAAAGVAPLCPDEAMSGGDVVRLLPAAAELLSARNLAAAAIRVRRRVLECAGAGSDNVASLRRAVKAGLHEQGLGLRHVWQVWHQAEAGSERDVGIPADGALSGVLESAYTCACLPSPGSSAALALESLVDAVCPRGRATKPQLLAACLAGRAAAAKGLGLAESVHCGLATRLLRCQHVGRVMASWLWLQRRTESAVKTAGIEGRHRARFSHAGFGAEYEAGASSASARLLSELAHRQRCGAPEGELPVLRRLGQLSMRQLDSPRLGLLALLRGWQLSTRLEGAELELPSLGILLNMGGHHRVALECHQRRHELLELRLGAEHGALGESWTNIGVCKSRLGDQAGALEAHRHALHLRLGLVGRDELATPGMRKAAVCATLNNIAACMLELSKPARALALLQLALEIQPAALGHVHADVGMSLSNVGLCKSRLGDHDGALEALEQALGIRAAALGRKHPEVGDTLYNIGTCEVANGRHAEALEAFKRALAIQLQALGKNNADVGASRSKIGDCKATLGDSVGAIKAFESAVAAYEVAPGDDHPDVGVCCHSLGMVRLSLGRFEGALKPLKRALSIRQAKLGEDHPDVGESWCSIGTCESGLNHHQQALEAHERALEIRRARLGDKHAFVGESWNDIGACKSELRDHSGALEAFEKALAANQAALGEDHASAGACWLNIGDSQMELGHHADALEPLQTAVRIFDAEHGADHPYTSAAKDLLKQCQAAMA